MSVIPDGSTGTDSGSTTAATLATRVFTIRNLGTSTLRLGSVTLSLLTNLTSASVTVQPSTTVAAGASTTFTVQFTPTANSAWSFYAQFNTNDAAAKLFDFFFQGVAASSGSPEIAVEYQSNNITDGGSQADDLDAPAGVPAGRSFVVKNVGTANLTLGTVTLSNPVNVTAQVVDTQPTTPVAAAGQTTFGIQFTPVANGVYSVDVNIPNNDASENPFNFSFAGSTPLPPLYALSDGFKVWISEDAQAWGTPAYDALTEEPNHLITSMAYISGSSPKLVLFLISLVAGPSRIVTTADGITWTSVSAEDVGFPAGSVFYGASAWLTDGYLFVLYIIGSETILRSASTLDPEDTWLVDGVIDTFAEQPNRLDLVPYSTAGGLATAVVGNPSNPAPTGEIYTCAVAAGVMTWTGPHYSTPVGVAYGTIRCHPTANQPAIVLWTLIDESDVYPTFNLTGAGWVDGTLEVASPGGPLQAFMVTATGQFHGYYLGPNNQRLQWRTDIDAPGTQFHRSVQDLQAFDVVYCVFDRNTTVVLQNAVGLSNDRFGYNVSTAGNFISGTIAGGTGSGNLAKGVAYKTSGPY